MRGVNQKLLTALSLQGMQVVYIGGSLHPEYGHDLLQPHSYFDCSDGNDEDHENLTIHISEVPGEGNESNIRCIQHQFDAHEEHDGIPPDHYSGDPNGE